MPNQTFRGMVDGKRVRITGKNLHDALRKNGFVIRTTQYVIAGRLCDGREYSFELQPANDIVFNVVS